MTVALQADITTSSIAPLMNKTVAVLGYGNQGHAHARNLRDSGMAVRVANRDDSPNGRLAKQHGFELKSIDETVKAADLVIIALPDEVQPEVFEQSIKPNLKRGATLGFLSGFNIRFGFIQPARDIGVVLVAPKGPGSVLRTSFETGRGIPCLFAIHQESSADDARKLGLAWAHAIGCGRAGIIETTFDAEADSDLFGEQAVLCGGLSYLILAAFETLVESGITPEVAYIECCHEVKQIADLIHSRGLAGMSAAISNTAEFGTHHAGPRLINDDVRKIMKDLLAEIQSAEFARKLKRDGEKGFPTLTKHRDFFRNHPIESAGEAVRSLMPWLLHKSKNDDSNPENVKR